MELLDTISVAPDATTSFYNTNVVDLLNTTGVANYQGWYVYMVAYGAFTSFAAIPGNVLTILAYIRYEELRNPTNLLICNQSMGDFITAIVAWLFIIWNYTEIGLELTARNKHACLLGLGLALFSVQTSIVNILTISMERFTAVVFTYEYYRWVTDHSVKILITLIWVLVCLVNLLPFTGLNAWQPGEQCMTIHVYPRLYFQLTFMAPCLFCLFITAIVNIIIAFIAIKKQRTVIVPAAPQDKSQQVTTSQFKVTKMLLTVVGCFYINWMPFLILNSLLFARASTWAEQGPPALWLQILFEVSKGSLILNGFFNPFIYSLNNKKFRIAYCKLLRINHGLKSPNSSVDT